MEAVGLSLAVGLEIVFQEVVNVRKISAATLFSKGFFDKILPIIEEKKPEVLVVDSYLSPVQQRNLEKLLKTTVIDRSALILEIFGERAKTKEGVLQVELAKLNYQRSRLVKMWTHLGRQRGGTSFIGGEGEKQIELDRRMIDDKILNLKKELEKVKKTRELQRGARKKVPYPIIALVGYTNVGKSSIFNKITKAGVFEKDLLFATLDTTMRRVRLKSGREVIFSDTVGFISDLPHELVMSFRATLEEVLEADIVVHIRDIASENSKAQRVDVLDVLQKLGLENIQNSDKYIELLNKIDLLEDKNFSNSSENILPVSAYSGEGIDKFLELIDKKLSKDYIEVDFSIDSSDGKSVSWLYDNAEVMSSKAFEDKVLMRIRISQENLSKYKSIFKK